MTDTPTFIPIRFALVRECCAFCGLRTYYQTEIPARGPEGQVPCCPLCSERHRPDMLPSKADYEASEVKA